MSEACEFTILLPCLNEAETLANCISKARAFLARSGCAGEVVIADNGSTDGSQAIAAANGARVVHVAERGYGSALLAGIRAAHGKYVIMGDSDDSYDFSRLDAFVEQLRAGYQLVMGKPLSRRYSAGRHAADAPLLGQSHVTAIGRLFFRSGCGDSYCGLRGFDRQAILSLDLQARGMEFALEMLVKAEVQHLRVTKVPTTLSPDGRGRPPHLRRWRDGWRSLRFFLLSSPRSLFLNPGLALFAIGCLATAWLLPQPRFLGGVGFDVHTLLYASLAIVVGFQSMTFWVFAKVYGMRERIVPPDPWFRSLMSIVTLEAGLIVGASLLLGGLGLAVYALGTWGAERFGALSYPETIRLVIPSSTAILLGFQIIYSAFFVSILEIRASRPTEGAVADRSAEAA